MGGVEGAARQYSSIRISIQGNNMHIYCDTKTVHMSYCNNLIHCVWGTKRRVPFITGSNRAQIIGHIRDYSVRMGIHIDFINGHKDHIHCLLSLSPTQTLSGVVMGIKGESSRWIALNVPYCDGFGWADDSYAISVSPGILNRVRDYIRDQDRHHMKKSWDHEQQAFIRTINHYCQQFPWDNLSD